MGHIRAPWLGCQGAVSEPSDYVLFERPHRVCPGHANDFDRDVGAAGARTAACTACSGGRPGARLLRLPAGAHQPPNAVAYPLPLRTRVGANLGAMTAIDSRFPRTAANWHQNSCAPFHLAA